MTRLRAFLFRLWALVRSRRMDREIDEEIASHLAEAKEEYIQRGLSPEDAHWASLRSFGGVTQTKEIHRQLRSFTSLDMMQREISHATRRLFRSPAFTLSALTTLGLAIGANVAIFTLVNRVVLNPLSYPQSERLIDLDHAAPGLNAPSGVAMTLGLYYHYGDSAHTLDAIALYNTGEATLTGNGEPDRIRVGRATQTLPAVLRVPPALGRWFINEETAPGSPRVAVLSHGLWTRRYGGDLSILGRPVILDGTTTMVVGIMPPSFAFPDPQVQAWIPIQDARSMVFDDFSYNGVARLRDGVTLADSRKELTALIARLPAIYPDKPATSGIVNRAKLMSVARTLKDAKVGRITQVLWVLLASVAFVLFVKYANVANLFLVRSEARQAEISVRRALGAGRSAVASYFASESALIAIVGGGLGLALAWGAVRLLVAFSPANLPRLEEVSLDGTAVLYSLMLTLVAGLVFSVIPLWRAAPVSATLHAQGRGNTASRTRHRIRYMLMGAQVALALVMLVASSLMIRSFQKLQAIDPGFNPASALTFRIGLPDREFRGRRAVVDAHQALIDRLKEIPGVTSVAASTRIPLDDVGRGFSSPMRIEGSPASPGTVPPIVAFNAVTADYFETMGTRLLRGRGIDRGDIDRRELVAVVNEALVKAYFPGQDPIGARVARGTGTVNSSWLTIVGVVPNTPIASLTEATATSAVPELYMPMSISGPPEVPGQSANGPSVAAMSYVVRSATPPLGLLPSVRQAVDAVDENLAVARLRTLQDLLDGASAQMAFTMVLLAIGAGITLLLGLVGIYGAISYIVSQRTNEIGIRLALGAEPRGVATMIIWQGGLVSLVGIAVGLGAALAGSRLLEALLYDVSPRGPVVFVTAIVTMFAVALAACWLPARRAAHVSPLEALRAE
jgi:putative ABC transport system permease protein